MKHILNSLKGTELITNVQPQEQVAIVLRKFAEWFPFENLDVMCKHTTEITPEFLETKLFKMRRGGLCYEINALLFCTLKELGFDVELGAATVNNEGKWALTGTHTIVLLSIGEQRFIADAGFGNRLALYPLEIDGRAVTSPAGTYRARTVQTEKGSIALESQTEEGEWVILYALYWTKVEWQKLNLIRNEIHNHSRSPFNKQLLIANVLPNGTYSINEERSLHKEINGRKKISQFATKSDMLQHIRSSYSSAIAKEVEKYLFTQKQ